MFSFEDDATRIQWIAKYTSPERFEREVTSRLRDAAAVSMGYPSILWPGKNPAVRCACGELAFWHETEVWMPALDNGCKAFHISGFCS